MDVPGGIRVFGSRFTDDLKQSNHGIRKKSLLVSQIYADEDAMTIAIRALKIHRFFQRLEIQIEASSTNMTKFKRDVTHAYLQSKTDMEREVLMK